jgi:hypothetical protein
VYPFVTASLHSSLDPQTHALADSHFAHSSINQTLRVFPCPHTHAHTRSYRADAIPCSTLLLVSIGAKAARVDGVCHEVTALSCVGNIFDAESMLEGALDDSFVDADDEDANAEWRREESDKKKSVKKSAKDKKAGGTKGGAKASGGKGGGKKSPGKKSSVSGKNAKASGKSKVAPAPAKKRKVRQLNGVLSITLLFVHFTSHSSTNYVSFLPIDASRLTPDQKLGRRIRLLIHSRKSTAPSDDYSKIRVVDYMTFHLPSCT